MRTEYAAALEYRRNVQVDDAPPLFACHARARLAGGISDLLANGIANAVDDDTQVGERREDLDGQRIHCSRVGCIGGETRRPLPEAFRTFRDFVDAPLSKRDHRHLGARLRERQRDATTDPATRADDDRLTALYVEIR